MNKGIFSKLKSADQHERVSKFRISNANLGCSDLIVVGQRAFDAADGPVPDLLHSVEVGMKFRIIEDMTREELGEKIKNHGWVLR